MSNDRAAAASCTDDPEAIRPDNEDLKPERRPLPDRPGDPKYPFRAESRRAAMEANQKSMESASDKTDEANSTDGLKPPQETSEQREQGTDDDRDEEPQSDRNGSENKPKVADAQPGQEGDQKRANTLDSLLERTPSYGNFQNLAEELDARAKSREFAERYGVDLATDRPDETSEAKIAEAPQDQDGASAERPDRDEPGSWRGEGGQYLNAEENIAAQHALDRIQKKEPEITGDLKSVERETDGRLVGLDYRLKGEDRFKEKLSASVRDNPEASIGELAGLQHDAIRYTYQFDMDNYVRGVEAVRRRLEESGYQLMRIRNSWDDPDYKGINTRWRTPEGQLFEVQFHTPESFAAKQETHGAYERLRSPKTPPEERGVLEEYQRDVTSRIAVPAGVDSIKDYRRR